MGCGRGPWLFAVSSVPDRHPDDGPTALAHTLWRTCSSALALPLSVVVLLGG